MQQATLNLGILAHVDAGKTSLTERLLFDNGATTELGSVDAGSTQTDSGELERERGITIRSAVASFTTGDLQVNLVDTPGHPDFIAEVERALSVLDAAVLLLSAVEGVQAQTRVLMKSLKRLGLPTLMFVNKIDRRGARTQELLLDIRRKLGGSVIPMTWVRDAGTSAATVVSSLLDAPDVRAEVAEILSEHDDALLARVLDGSIPGRDDLKRLLVEQTAAGLVHPLFFGSALTGAGARELTDGIRTLLPPSASSDAALRGTVFAIERARGGEKVAYVRLFSGELRGRQRITVRRRESGGRVTKLKGRITGLDVVGGPPTGTDEAGEPSPDSGSSPSGRGRSRLKAGGIAKVRGLHQIRVGDELGEVDGPAVQAHFSPPSLETVVRPRERGQETRLHAALKSLADEDPFIRTRTGAGGSTSVLLYGEVQKEVIAARLEREFGLEVEFEPVQPVYFERPVGVGESAEEFDRHAHSAVFWATIGLRVEPAPFGAGVRYVRAAGQGSLPLAFHRAIEKTALQTLEQGLYGWEVTDCIVTLIRAGYNAPTSVGADFRNLTPLVLMRALRVARTHVYEPCQSLEVEVPDDVATTVMGHLSALGGEVTDSIDKGATWLITAELPVRLVHQFLTALPGQSRGEGAVWSRPGTDRPLRGAPPVRERTDGNPLNYDEYMRFLADRNLASVAVPAPDPCSRRSS